MKWLLLDDPSEHRSTMHQNFSAGLKLYNQEVKVSFTLKQALEMMRLTAFDYVVIHHYDFSKVDTLRKSFPNVKYCANSTNITLPAKPGTLAEKFNELLLEHYDLLIPDSNKGKERFLEKETGLKIESILAT